MWGTIPAILRTILAMFVASVPSITVAQTAEEKQAVACPHREGWKPADLPLILANHQTWLEKWKAEDFSWEWKEGHSQGMANLCNADLHEFKLNNADLRGAKLSNANLFKAELNKADLRGAELNKADLTRAKLSNANLSLAKLNNANLSLADVDRAYLADADVTGAFYAPASPPPDPYVAGIKGLRTVTFSPGEEVGLAQSGIFSRRLAFAI